MSTELPRGFVLEDEQTPNEATNVPLAPRQAAEIPEGFQLDTELETSGGVQQTPDIPQYPQVGNFGSGSEIPEGFVLEQPRRAPDEDDDGPNALTRGLVSGTLDQNPELLASSFDGFAEVLPEAIGAPLRGFAESLRELKDLPADEYETRAKSLFEVGGIGEALTLAGEQLGLGLASTVPVVAGGVAGGAVGSAAGPVGTAVGAGVGALTPSFLLNYGEINSELQRAGVGSVDAAQTSFYVAPLTTGLDVLSAGPIISRLGGMGAVKGEANRRIAQRIAEEMAKGAGREGITEAAQDVINKAAVSVKADQPFWNADTVESVLTSGLAGGLTGGVIGGTVGVIPDRVVDGPEGLDGEQPVAGQPVFEEGMDDVRGYEPAPVFYSQVAQAVSDRVPNAASAEQILSTIKKTPGVKEEEIEALNIPEYLEGAKGKISKSDLLAHLEENAIEVITETQGGPPLTGVEVEAEPMVEWHQASVGMLESSDGNFSIQSFSDGSSFLRARDGGFLGDFPDVFQAQLAAEEHARERAKPRYEEYTLLGGTNYGWTTLRLAKPLEGQRDFRDPETMHPRDPNIVAWVRHKDRVDDEGRRVLHVEEIQSPWMQAGRTRGFLTKKKRREIAEAQGKADLFYKRLDALMEREQLAPRFRAEIYKRLQTDRGRRSLVVKSIGTKWERVFRQMDEAIYDEELLERQTQFSVPDAPFKSSWHELAIKRILRFAADHGYERVVLTPGDVQSTRYYGTVEENSGLKSFYDEKLVAALKKWGKKLKTKVGATSFPADESITEVGLFGPRRAIEYDVALETPFPYIDITPNLVSRVQRGLPLFEDDPRSVPVASERGTEVAKELVEAGRKSAKVIEELKSRIGISQPIAIRFAKIPESSYAHVLPYFLGDKFAAFEITLDPTKMQSAAEVYSSMSHEFGHIVVWTKFHGADTSTQIAIMGRYEQWRQDALQSRNTHDLMNRKVSFVSNIRARRDFPNIPFNQYSAEKRRYFLSFDEYMADQVARWMTTGETPLTVVDRFFSRLARTLRDAYDTFKRVLGIDAEPEQWIGEWLESLATEPQAFSEPSVESVRRRTMLLNQIALDQDGTPHFEAEPYQVSGMPIRRMFEELAVDDHPGARAFMAAHDKFNVFYKYMIGVVQLADLNPHVAPLQRYRELWQVKQLERAQIMNRSLETIQAWEQVGPEQERALAKFLDEYMNGTFLTEEEQQNGTMRRPSQAEYARLRRSTGLNDRGWAVFQQVQRDFDNMLDLYEAQLTRDAESIQDAGVRSQRIQDIRAEIANYKRQPYVPAMRFGDWTITVRDAEGNAVEFYTYEKQKQRDKALAEIRRDLSPGDVAIPSVLSKDAASLVGLPPGLLDKIGEKLDLSPDQRSALDELKLDYAPAQSFKHRFRRKNRTPGYSLDFKRAYANYFFHGSNYFTKVKYVDQLKDQIRATRESAQTLEDPTKRVQISNYMSNHLSYMMDPKGDFAKVRAGITMWVLGFSPAAASLNLSQMLIGTYPFLASKFGDGRTVKQMLKSGADLSTFYRRGTLDMHTEADLRALSEGIKEGIITEAMAPELAARSEADNLETNLAAKPWQKFNTAMRYGMKMFEMSEQVNRRITFRAAWKLALNDPNARYVRESVEKHRLQFDRLLSRGWDRREAAAFVVAKDATESTQFVYQQYAQPAFMRGRWRTVFVFKTFLQNTLFMLWNYPSAAVRSFLVLGFLGGLMGLPGAEDLKGMIRAIGFKVFGKDWDVEREARRFVIDLLDDTAAEGIPADLLLHGTARYGFGFKDVADLVGVPFPRVDRSQAIGLGQILPIDVGTAFGPKPDVDRALTENLQRASGAAFGTAFNVYRALEDITSGTTPWDDFKSWEKAMPRQAAALSKAWRAYQDERERTRTGATVVRFNTSDVNHMAELIGRGLGYNPHRLSAKWDSVIAQREVISYWNIRRGLLLKQLNRAYLNESKAEQKRVIGAIKRFNRMLPKFAELKVIDRDTIRSSLRTRAQSRAAIESGVPRSRSDVPIAEYIQSLYPEAEVDVRPVPRRTR